jgi:hypothetical protein
MYAHSIWTLRRTRQFAVSTQYTRIHTSAILSVLNPLHILASSWSCETPSAPKHCIARSTTSRAMDGTTNYDLREQTNALQGAAENRTLAMPISFIAPFAL